MNKNVTQGDLADRVTDITQLDPIDMSNNPYNYYFPTGLYSVENLLGKFLTQIEAMNLKESAERANKDIARQIVWNWWSDVQENSITSYKGCIGAIKLPPSTPEKIRAVDHDEAIKNPY